MPKLQNLRMSYDLMLTCAESHPPLLAVLKQHGTTPAQFAAYAWGVLNNAGDQRTRDWVVAEFGRDVGVTTNGEAGFLQGMTHEALENGATVESMRATSERLAAESLQNPHVPPSTAERIRHVGNGASKAWLTQQLGDRFRDRDAEAARRAGPAREVPEHLRRFRDDEHHRRESLGAAIRSAQPRGMVQLRDQHDSVRDTLEAAFAAHDAYGDDPLADQSLRDASNAI